MAIALDDTLVSHLRELRQRLLVVLGTIALGSGVAYYFAGSLVKFFLAPLWQAAPTIGQLVYTNLTEALVSYLKLSVLVGLSGSFPVLLYQAWRYVAPGLRPVEKKWVALVGVFATALFGGGVAFSFLVVLPRALTFLLGFAGPELEALPKLGDYLGFVGRSCLAFGLAFEIPFLMVVAGKVGLARPGYFRRQRRYFYLLILGLAFLVAVGEFVSTALLAIPLVLLYEAGVLLLRLFPAAVADNDGRPARTTVS